MQKPPSKRTDTEIIPNLKLESQNLNRRNWSVIHKMQVFCQPHMTELRLI